MSFGVPRYPLAPEEVPKCLTLVLGITMGIVPLTVWRCPGWRVVACDYLPSLDPGPLAEVVPNWL